MSVVSALTWASGLAALFAIGVYFYVLAKRPQWVRLVNGSGLFFTGAALTQVAVLLPGAAAQGALFTVAVTVALLIAAVLAQSWSALQNRRAWDGVDRRTDANDVEPQP
jgi:RsiW-degrading membrane proteinase PrsW (M82 family)